MDFTKKYLRKTIAKLRDFRRTHPAISLSIIIVLLFCFSVIGELLFRKIYGRFLHTPVVFRVERLALISIAVGTIGLVLYFGKKGQEFIYKFRFLFGIVLFALCVGMKLNYSSIGVLDTSLQPSFSVQSGDVLFGRDQSIRSDEYVVTTPATISQYYNGLNIVNPDIMADDVVTTLYPKMPNPLTILVTPQFAGFAFLPLENAFSFYQLLPWFVAFFAVFEMLMVITKKRKLISLVGSLFVIFSPVMLWFDCVQYVMYVALLFDIFYIFIERGKTWKSRLGFACLFGWIAACFIMNIYPAWQLAYGYVLLGLLVFLLLEYRHKLKWTYLIYIIPCVCIIGALVVPNILISLEQYKITMETVYPGKRFIIGGDNPDELFYYIPSVFFPASPVDNPCEASGFIGLFPLPLILGAYLSVKTYRSKKVDRLFVPLLLISALFLFIYLVGNEFIARITLLYMSPPGRIRPALEFICVIILIRIVSLYCNNIKTKHPTICAISSAIITAFLVYRSSNAISHYIGSEYMTIALASVAFCIFFTVIYCILSGCKRNNYIIGAIALAFAVYNFLTILPLKVGLDTYMDKPVAIKIRELSSENQEARWLADGSVLGSFALANDARVINSVNYYPVFRNWQPLDKNGENEDIYNRYAHIGIKITTEETTFEYLTSDSFTINLNYQQICSLSPTYFLTTGADYSGLFDDLLDVVYSEDGIYIYKVNCSS